MNWLAIGSLLVAGWLWVHARIGRKLAAADFKKAESLYELVVVEGRKAKKYQAEDMATLREMKQLRDEHKATMEQFVNRITQRRSSSRDQKETDA